MDPSIVTEFARMRFKRHQSHPPPERNPHENEDEEQQRESDEEYHKRDSGKRDKQGPPQTRDDLLSVHDLHTALEESAQEEWHDTEDAPMTMAAAAMKPAKRRAWRRRCKSTSNLAIAASTSVQKPGESSTAAGATSSSRQKASGQKGITSTSSDSSEEDNDTGLHRDVQTSHIGKALYLGTLGLSESDDDEELRGIVAAAAANKGLTPARPGATANLNMGSHRVLPPPNTGTGFRSIAVKHPSAFLGESDSVNETLSSSSRPLNPKRKRKFKRMALDPDPGLVEGKNSATTRQSSKGAMPATLAPTASSSAGPTKRQKIRQGSRSLKPTGLGSSEASAVSVAVKRQQQPLGTVMGKRKRSNREKSQEPDHFHHHHVSQSPPGEQAQTMMDCDTEPEGEEGLQQSDDDEDTSSSISSSEWEEEDQQCYENHWQDPGREGDDEQSDWPGNERSLGNCLDDDDDECDETSGGSTSPLSSLFLSPLEMESTNPLTPMTATARQTYLARMKRLAECVPGREIRAGARKLRNRQSSFTIKSSSSEQVSRFLQDPSRTELKLSLMRTSDRNKVMRLANLYSLSARLQLGHQHFIILSKTGKTVKVTTDFAVPGSPAVTGTAATSTGVAPGNARTTVEFKRRRLTPPNSPMCAPENVTRRAQRGSASDLQQKTELDHRMDADEVAGPATRPVAATAVQQHRSESPLLGASEVPASVRDMKESKLSGSQST